MTAFFLILIFSSVFNKIINLSPLRSFPQRAQEICHSTLPKLSTFQNELNGLLCGIPFYDLSSSELYFQTSTIHLFVVSGTHLLMLKKYFVVFKIQKTISILLLAIYAIFCGLNPPVFRALLFVLLIEIQKFYVLRNDQKVLFTGLTALAICPQWINSFSFLLSWTAALALVLDDDSPTWKSLFVSQFLLWLFLSPMLTSIASPTTWLLNLVTIPVFNFIILPLAFLCWIENIFGTKIFLTFFDISLASLNKFLDIFSSDLLPVHQFRAMTSLSLKWLCLIALHLCLHFFFVKYERRKWFH